MTIKIKQEIIIISFSYPKMSCFCPLWFPFPLKHTLFDKFKYFSTTKIIRLFCYLLMFVQQNWGGTQLQMNCLTFRNYTQTRAGTVNNNDMDVTHFPNTHFASRYHKHHRLTCCRSGSAQKQHIYKTIFRTERFYIYFQI